MSPACETRELRLGTARQLREPQTRCHDRRERPTGEGGQLLEEVVVQDQLLQDAEQLQLRDGGGVLQQVLPVGQDSEARQGKDARVELFEAVGGEVQLR